jgi:ABC-type multidrug transport system fused ATPase/permease subunit
VQAAIEEVVKDCTSIVIAHRLSTILHANRIVVLRDGCIVEVGTHSELLARNGEYSELYTQQFAPQLVLEGKG